MILKIEVELLLAVLLALTVSCLSQQQAHDRRCHSYDSTCTSCIQTPGCQWCSAFTGNSSNLHRCFSSSADSSAICAPGHTTNPSNEYQVVQNLTLTKVNKDKSRYNEEREEKDIVQLAPQIINLRLRKGEPFNVTFRFRLATDYPVDLYYLMDLSKSMEDDKDNLAKLGRTLAQTMRNLTSKFRLGFGSYVDKVVMPYANVHPAKINEPCLGCAPPYSFRNDLPLDTDDRKFTKKVRETPISGNVDAPEGGLDALLQAIVCWDDIGWRKQARRLLIMSTDAKFHHAGDGRLAGIVQPHDGLCHLTDGTYTHYAILDYPSIAQINEAARKNQVNIIFAVSNHDELYKTLSAAIAHSSQGMLDSQSSNVVNLVVQQYSMLSSEVKLSDNVATLAGSPVSVRYYSSCLDRGAPPHPTRTCKEIKEGNEIEFIAQVEVVDVPVIEQHRRVQVNITTFQDTLTLNIDMVAECDCEKPNAPGRVVDAPQCSRSGTLQCGVCSCRAGHYGNQCQCSSDRGRDADNSAEDAAQCLSDPKEAELCSGQGVCECGTCICASQSLSGKYCQCNEDHCSGGNVGVGRVSAGVGGGSSRVGGASSGGSPYAVGGADAHRLLCSGRGICDCGVCLCQPGWSGKFCECPNDDACMLPGSSEVCSGKGECSCGQCSCQSIHNVLYTGKYCEDCSTCSSGKCEEFRDCVQCRVFHSGPLAGAGCSNCTVQPRELASLETEMLAGARLCTSLDESTECDFNFTYEYRAHTQDYFLVAQVPQQCPAKLDVLVVVLGVIGGVVAIGLLTLLLWKVLTTIQDRRDFAKFENERKNVQWGTEKSPIYKPAVDTFVNPAFAGQQEVEGGGGSQVKEEAAK